MPAKKILFCYRYLILGGVLTQLYNRFQIIRHDFDIEFLFIEDHLGNDNILPESLCHILPTKTSRAEFLRENRFDAISIIDLPEIYDELPDNFDSKIFHEIHTTYELEDKIQSLTDKLNHFKPQILVPSNYIKEVLKQFTFCGDLNLKVLPNCIDSGLFEVENNFPEEKSDPIFLWIGKLDEHKNWKTFLAHAELILKKDKPASFWMLGGYTARQDVKLDFFKELSQKGLAANLRWFPKIAYSEIVSIYRRVGKSGGGLIVTSKDESFGMVVAEAMLCFCPVLVNKVGALPELVKHAKTGWLHDNSFRSLSNCLADIKDLQKRRKVCEQANELIKAEYSLEKVRALFKKLVQSG